MSLSFKPADDGVVIYASTKDNLKNELGRGADQMREQSLVDAIATPAEWMKKRTEYLDELFDKKDKLVDGKPHQGKVYRAFTEATKEYASLNMPPEAVKAYALKMANRAYEDELLIQELKHPGLAQALGRYEDKRKSATADFTVKNE